MGGLISFSRLKYLAVITGIITRATNSEEVSTTIKVIGRIFINSPTMPFQKTRGKNAASVVAVDAMMGTAISPTAYLAAENKECPW